MTEPLKLSFGNAFYHITHLATIFYKKEGFFKSFVVLVLKCRKIEKD